VLPAHPEAQQPGSLAPADDTGLAVPGVAERAVALLVIAEELGRREATGR